MNLNGRVVWMSLAVFLFVFGVPAMAQGPQPPTPGSEHKMLAEMVGEWDADMVMPGVEQPVKCKAKYAVSCGGLWITSDFEAGFGPDKFTGRGTDGYDLRKKKFVSVWVDSMTTTPCVFEGDYDAATKTITQTAKGVGMDGRPVVWRNTTRFVDHDNHVFEMFSTPEGGTEAKAFTITYKRRM